MELYAVIDRLPQAILGDRIEAMIARLDRLDGDCDFEADEDTGCEDQGGAL